MTEKRIYKRRQLIYYMKVLERDTSALIGYLVDLTPEGLLLMCETRVDPGGKYNLKIQMKKEAGDNDYLTVSAKCKWCHKEMYADFFDAGFEMTNISGDEQKKIEQIIEKLCFKD